MYLDYFSLKEFPFSLVSDPKFLYLSADHARVKAYMEYAMQIQDSFLVCTGEIGTGKTTLVNDALAHDHPQAKIARIQVNQHTSEEFLQQLSLEFGISPYTFQRIEILDKLKLFLAQQFRSGIKVFLFVDDAHNLSTGILEDIRYLSDMESQGSKLLSVILVGQPELNALIDQPEMEHLSQRVKLRCHIKPLNPNETVSYINHRLRIAGSRQISVFSSECMPVIHQFTGGRMRLINTLCDYALLHCCVEKQKHVDTLVIQTAANELKWEAYEKRFGESKDVTRYSLSPEKKAPGKIIVKQNSYVVDEVDLSKDCLTLGRQSDNDIPIDDFKVSRYHAQILTQGNMSYLHDLNSTNGTFIDKNRINVHLLKSGEAFTIGNYEFIFTQSVMVDVSENREPEAMNDAIKKDVTRQMTLDQRDHTRIQYKQPYISLVSPEVE